MHSRYLYGLVFIKMAFARVHFVQFCKMLLIYYTRFILHEVVFEAWHKKCQSQCYIVLPEMSFIREITNDLPHQ